MMNDVTFDLQQDGSYLLVPIVRVFPAFSVSMRKTLTVNIVIKPPTSPHTTPT